VLGAELKGKIRVYVRWRPMSSKEIADEERAVSSGQTTTQSGHPGREEGRPFKEYHMDWIFDETSTQAEVFAGTKVSGLSLATFTTSPSAAACPPSASGPHTLYLSEIKAGTGAHQNALKPVLLLPGLGAEWRHSCNGCFSLSSVRGV